MTATRLIVFERGDTAFAFLWWGSSVCWADYEAVKESTESARSTSRVLHLIDGNTGKHQATWVQGEEVEA